MQSRNYMRSTNSKSGYVVWPNTCGKAKIVKQFQGYCLTSTNISSKRSYEKTKQKAYDGSSIARG